MGKKYIVSLIFFIQKILMNISSFFCHFLVKKTDSVVLGCEEIATLLHSLGDITEDSVTVNFSENIFYDYKYDFDLRSLKFFKYMKYILSPLLLGYLIKKHKTFVYIGGSGFLLNKYDGRAYEFEKLKKNKCNIICYFTGSDIRSFEKMKMLSLEMGIDVITTYQSYSHSDIGSAENENIRKMLAQSADSFASAIFNASVDQASYIKSQCYPFLYPVEKNKFLPKNDKFNKKRKVVLHAPSSPIIKGTPIVRAAVKNLKEQGYDFEYVELIGVSNKEVLRELDRAHIVLNQFYAFVPSVFGVEALAANTVLLTSADKRIEPCLFGDANKAWIVTPYWRVCENLKECLDRPMVELENQAKIGATWAKEFCTYEFVEKTFNRILQKNK